MKLISVFELSNKLLNGETPVWNLFSSFSAMLEQTYRKKTKNKNTKKVKQTKIRKTLYLDSETYKRTNTTSLQFYKSILDDTRK